MTRRVLLVFSKADRQTRDLIEDGLAGASVAEGLEPIAIDPVSTVLAAEDKLKSAVYELIVVGIGLAKTPLDVVDPLGGLVFCEGAGAQSGARLMLVVPDRRDDIVKRCEALGRPVEIAVVNSKLPEQVLALLDRRPLPQPPLNVVIYAKEGNDWEYELHSENGPVPTPSGIIRIPEAFAITLNRLSQVVQRAPDDEWRPDFASIGQSLTTHFWENPKFADDIKKALQRAQRRENTRVSFVVSQSRFNIPLEAMNEPPSGTRPWMVRVPLFRRIAEGAPPSPGLFGGFGYKLRALVVRADVSGYLDTRVDVHGDAERLEQLECINRECDTLVKMFKDTEVFGERIEVEEFPPDGRVQVNLREFLECLDRGWDIVHFAGHSRYEMRENRGILYIGKRDAPVELDISEMAPRLGRVRLLYLSSCESANAPFAVAAAKAGIPAVVGFRWKAEDSDAAMHAILFYRNLFKHCSVETAFLRTRRVIYRRANKKRIWASSVLVMGGN